MNDKKLIIAETNTSQWNYHLREIKPGEERYSGGAGNSLCGRSLGWDTHIPLSSWGLKGNVPSSYCKKCREIATQKGYLVGGENETDQQKISK
ncbi:hypothetical protein [Bdellovibrio sp. BCCA]|uniref:hypothetical protein n=1 Tax=Bdellovibrio sp. BCCA TaxID=3136281 RepID=UPI0030F010E4